MIHGETRSGLHALSARGEDHVPSLVEIGMSVRSPSFPEKRAIALNLPLEYLLAVLDLFLLRVAGIGGGQMTGGLSKTVRAARSLLGLARIDSRSLPTEFLGESGVWLGSTASDGFSKVVWGPWSWRLVDLEDSPM